MEGEEAVEVLFAQFGYREFLTRDIRPDVMDQLAGLMEIHETDHIGRNSKVGRGIGSLEGKEYTLQSGQKVKMAVTRSENSYIPRHFRFVDSNSIDHNSSDKIAATGPQETGLAYDVVLVETGYGWAAFCPALLGCVSQGEDEADAFATIQEAIAAWLAGESKAVKRRIRELVYEYRAAGYPVRTTTIKVNRIIE